MPRTAAPAFHGAGTQGAIAAAIMVLAITGATASDISLRFLALGDSYTIGEGVAAAGRWPQQLATALQTAGINVAAPEVVAQTGWTTDELAAAMERHSYRPPYDLVTLLIGVNNQYRGRHLDNYRREFRTLLERAIALAGGRPGRVIVVSIPDWGVTRFGRESGRDAAQVAREIDAYNAVNREIGAELGTQYADVTPASRDRGDSSELLASDGLHPSAAMYARWLQVIVPAAERALAER